MKRQSVAILAMAAAQLCAALACGLPAVVSPASTARPSATDAALPPPPQRETAIPPGAVKMSPQTDEHPPLSYSAEFANPLPLPSPINSAGAEDSPFITRDGETLYFFFTPDVTIPAEQQLLDGVTGIYAARRSGGDWGRPQRVLLQDAGKLALDGCEFVAGDVMWFCSARQGYVGIHWFTAEARQGSWQNWQLADFDAAFEVGELHFSADGSQLYFGSGRPGGKGQMDIWVSLRAGGEWQPPENIAAVNTADSEGWPALNAAEDELWFTRNYGVWRSKKVNGDWQAAELIFSPLAGEPTLDSAGNVYFVHHFYRGDQMIEADIYVAARK